MHRHPRYYVVGVIWLLFVCHVIKAAKSSLSPLKIDTSKSGDDSGVVQDTCKRILSNDTQILAIGRLINNFVIVTTDLFVFELLHKQVDPTILPPFQVLVNEKPKHMRNRFPSSYPALERISNNILHAGLMSTKHQDEVNEYIVFAHATNGTTVCLLAIDVLRDKAMSGPCDAELAVAQAISNEPNKFSLEMSYLKQDEKPMVICLGMTFWYLSATNYYNGENLTACTSMNKCQLVVPMTPMDMQSNFNYQNPYCIKIPSEIIVSGFFLDATQMHLIDSHQVVYSLMNTLISLDFVKSSLDKFIGCNEAIPYKIDYDSSKMWMVIGIFVAVQLAICVVIYFAVKGINEMPSKTKKNKQQSRKNRKKIKKGGKSISSKSRRSINAAESSTSSKSRKSISSKSSRSINAAESSTSSKSRKSISSKSRRSINAVAGSKSSKSRKARGSTSRSVSRNSASPLNSTIVSKCRTSRLSRSSKSRLSRGSNKQSKSVAPMMSTSIRPKM